MLRHTGTSSSRGDKKAAADFISEFTKCNIDTIFRPV